MVCTNAVDYVSGTITQATSGSAQLSVGTVAGSNAVVEGTVGGQPVTGYLMVTDQSGYCVLAFTLS